MSSQPDEHDQTASSEFDRAGTGECSDQPAPSPPICWVCQRPIADESPRRMRGEPIHARCGVELRCGASVGAPTEK